MNGWVDLMQAVAIFANSISIILLAHVIGRRS